MTMTVETIMMSKRSIREAYLKRLECASREGRIKTGFLKICRRFRERRALSVDIAESAVRVELLRVVFVFRLMIFFMWAVFYRTTMGRMSCKPLRAANV